MYRGVLLKFLFHYGIDRAKEQTELAGAIYR